MSPLPITEHADAEALASAVAGSLAEAIRSGIESRGEAWLALAGGGTPFAAYRKLAALDLPWANVHLVASDERWVPADHPRRNERALREAFAAARGVAVHPLVPNDADVEAFAAFAAPGASSHSGTDLRLRTAETHLAPLGRRAFDAVLLGMGADAHFASLFPQVTPPSALDAGDRAPAVAVMPDPLPLDSPFPRVSLSLSRLVAAHALLLMITGDTKRRVLEGARSRAAVDAPIHALLAAAPDLAIHWSP